MSSDEMLKKLCIRHIRHAGQSTEFTSRLAFLATLLANSVLYWSEMADLSASTFDFIYTKMSTTKRSNGKISLDAEQSLPIRHNNAL